MGPCGGDLAKTSGVSIGDDLTGFCSDNCKVKIKPSEIIVKSTLTFWRVYAL